MKKMYFITGVNGVGKTSVIEPLRSLLGPGFEVHDFDERGVPDNASRQWRLDETKYWIELGEENFKKNIITVICGFAKPSEIENPSIGLILLDADEKTIEQRLLNRYQTSESRETIERVSGKSVEKFIADNVYFSNVIREDAHKMQVPVIDTNKLTPEQVAQEILSILNTPKL